MATCPTCRTHYSNDVTTCSTDGATLVPDETLPPEEAPLTVGQTVGEYRIEGKLGEGGFGAVYSAVHPLIGKSAAVKVLHRQFSSNPHVVSRFVAEARAVNQIKNRNIIDIFSFGTLEDGRQYYVMELLEGQTMDAYLRRKGRLTPEEAMPIFRGIARALDAAHGAGIAHRDLKPENVFLSFEDDGAVFPKLLDFGIAKLLGDSATGAHKTRTGAPIGTPYYMSPEQCRGRNVDQRTDLYSFGVLVFLTLVGRLPFDGDDVMDLLIKHTSAPAPRVSEACPGLPAALDAPVQAFLEKDPAMRPASVGAGLDALAAAAAGAGFDVVVSGRRTGDPPQVRIGNTGGTPAQIAALVDARTITPTGGTSTESTQRSASTPTSRGLVMAIAAVGALAVVGAAVFMIPRATARHRHTVVDVAPTVTPPPTPPPPPPPTIAQPPPQITPSAHVAAPAEIELTVDSIPKVVEVYQGVTKIGMSTAPVRIKRAEGNVKLTFKATGFVARDVEVPASANGVVTVRLVKVANGNGRRPDLEF